MKRFIKFSIICIVAFTCSAFSGDKPKGDAPVAILMKTIKDVSYKKSGADWTNAKMGIPLSTNDEVKTGDKSLALIKFTDNSILRVRENSSLKIYADKNNKDLSKNTYIDKGKVGFQVTHQQNEEFKFTTPTMVASIRGTGGLFDVSQDSTLLILGEGSVEMAALEGLRQSALLTAGNYAIIGRNGSITIYPNGNAQNQDLENSKKVNIKKMTIKTNQGDLIIEYLGDN